MHVWTREGKGVIHINFNMVAMHGTCIIFWYLLEKSLASFTFRNLFDCLVLIGLSIQLFDKPVSLFSLG
jgi:hypothetical protein